MTGIRFPVEAGLYPPRHRVQTGSGANPTPYAVGIPSPGVKRPERAADH